MAYWGQALVLGPNINAMMEPNEEPQALQIVQKAKSLMVKASPRERALISALEKRYSGNTENRTANNKAYAEAMREVHQRFPDDPDIAMLYVESVMDLRPWGYWMRDGYPYEGTTKIVALTEEVMRRHPGHPGALHMYKHARAGGEGGRYPADADAGGGAHDTHVIAHLSACRPIRRLDEEQSARHRSRRGLHHAVPCPGDIPHDVLPA